MIINEKKQEFYIIKGEVTGIKNKVLNMNVWVTIDKPFEVYKSYGGWNERFDLYTTELFEILNATKFVNEYHSDVSFSEFRVENLKVTKRTEYTLIEENAYHQIVKE